jgi:serine O-acetyltransferase
MSGGSTPRAEFQRLVRAHQARRPPLGRALRADGVCFAAHRGEPFRFTTRSAEWRNVIRLLGASADYVALALYRVRTALAAHHVPVLPALLSKVSLFAFGLHIGDYVVIEPGVYVPHGTAVIDGVTTIGSGSVISPWVTVGLDRGNPIGPRIGPGVFIGSHASVLGDISVGLGAKIGAGAVVVRDVEPGTIVGGVPARVLGGGAKPVPDVAMPIVEVAE